MLFVFWLLLVVVVACLLLLMLGLRGRAIYNHYCGGRAVTCPETRQQVGVRFDALHVATTGLSGRAAFRLADCTRWPMRADCGQECIHDAIEAEPYTKGEVDLPKTKKIYHLPVLMAAFAAWVVGAFWHSQYLLRPSWMQALGLSPADLRQMVRWWTPHLLSVAACLLFAYGVAWLLAWRGRSGLGQGIVTAISLWLALVLAALLATGWAGMPGDLLRIELAYTILASAVVGAVIGGFSGKLVVD